MSLNHLYSGTLRSIGLTRILNMPFTRKILVHRGMSIIEMFHDITEIVSVTIFTNLSI